MSNKKNMMMDAEKPKPKREREVVDAEEEDEEEEEEEIGVSKVDMAQEHLKELPQIVRKRVKALEHIQKMHLAIDKQYREELDALERKYMALHAPLQDRRTAIVAGEAEPTDEETKDYIADPTAPNGDAKGVPLFWYHALTNNEAVRSLTGLNDRDKEALAALRDVRYSLLPRVPKEVDGKQVVAHGFSLTFTFAENEFFSDTVLTKTYHLTEDDSGEPMFDHSEATKPQWKAGKNLTVRVIKKAVPRPKRGGRGGRGAGGPQFQTVEEPCESFFQFFSPANMPDAGSEMEPEEFEELTEAVQGDFEAGCEIRDAVCPRAVLWYNGEAVEEDDDDEDWDDEDEDDLDGEEGDEDEDDEDDDEDEEEERPKGKKGGAHQAAHKFAPPPGSANPQQNPECKQQ